MRKTEYTMNFISRKIIVLTQEKEIWRHQRVLLKPPDQDHLFFR